MKMTVDIVKDNKTGTVTYDSDTNIVNVDFPGDRAVAEVHLTKRREFWIPESQKSDDYRIDKARPTDSETYMKLALCELYSATGFWVDWDTLKEEG